MIKSRKKIIKKSLHKKSKLKVNIHKKTKLKKKILIGGLPPPQPVTLQSVLDNFERDPTGIYYIYYSQISEKVDEPFGTASRVINMSDDEWTKFITGKDGQKLLDQEKAKKLTYNRFKKINVDKAKYLLIIGPKLSDWEGIIGQIMGSVSVNERIIKGLQETIDRKLLLSKSQPDHLNFPRFVRNTLGEIKKDRAKAKEDMNLRDSAEAQLTNGTTNLGSSLPGTQPPGSPSPGTQPPGSSTLSRSSSSGTRTHTTNPTIDIFDGYTMNDKDQALAIDFAKRAMKKTLTFANIKDGVKLSYIGLKHSRGLVKISKEIEDVSSERHKLNQLKAKYKMEFPEIEANLKKKETAAYGKIETYMNANSKDFESFLNTSKSMLERNLKSMDEVIKGTNLSKASVNAQVRYSLLTKELEDKRSKIAIIVGSFNASDDLSKKLMLTSPAVRQNMMNFMKNQSDADLNRLVDSIQEVKDGSSLASQIDKDSTDELEPLNEIINKNPAVMGFLGNISKTISTAIETPLDPSKPPDLSGIIRASEGVDPKIFINDLRKMSEEIIPQIDNLRKIAPTLETSFYKQLNEQSLPDETLKELKESGTLATLETIKTEAINSDESLSSPTKTSTISTTTSTESEPESSSEPISSAPTSTPTSTTKSSPESAHLPTSTHVPKSAPTPESASAPISSAPISTAPASTPESASTSTSAPINQPSSASSLFNFITTGTLKLDGATTNASNTNASNKNSSSLLNIFGLSSKPNPDGHLKSVTSIDNPHKKTESKAKTEDKAKTDVDDGSKAEAEVEAKEKTDVADGEVKEKADAESKEKDDAKAKAEAEDKEKAKAEAEAEAKAKAEAEDKEKAKAEAEDKEKAKAEAEAKAKAEAEAKAKAKASALADPHAGGGTKRNTKKKNNTRNKKKSKRKNNKSK